MVSKETGFCFCFGVGPIDLRSLASNSARQLDVLWHDRDSLGVNRAQVRVLKERNQVGFGRFLESQNRRSLEAEVVLEVLSDFSDEALKRELSDEQVGRLLVAANLSKSDSAWSVAVRLLHSSSCWSRFACCFCGELFARRFASC